MESDCNLTREVLLLLGCCVLRGRSGPATLLSPSPRLALELRLLVSDTFVLDETRLLELSRRFATFVSDL